MGRHAALTAGLLVSVSANVMLAVLIASLIALLLPAAESMGLVLDFSGCGLVFCFAARPRTRWLADPRSPDQRRPGRVAPPGTQEPG
ncbi:MAG TPA: hypothetical protein VIV12_25995, partial [Streptosporangiaceae bacterium]